MSLSYAWERFHKAVDTLATSHGTLQRRLARAFADHVGGILPDQIPEDLWPDYRRLMNQVDQLAGRVAQDSYGEVIAGLSDENATELAKAVVDLYATIQDRQLG